jgi:hypothetical protein
MSRQQSAAHYHNLKLANRAFENVAKDKHFSTTPKYHNCMYEEFKEKLNSGSA